MTIDNLSKSKLYLIALSGGSDSIALALLMKERGIRVHALHCNFHLRKDESDRDEEFVKNFCKQNNIPLTVNHFDTSTSAKEHGVSIEMEAREQRYSWFAEMVEKMQAEAICVAHHKDDQAETILLNLIRGTGLCGLAAMHPSRQIKGMCVLRPLLNITKSEILKYLDERGQSYVTDSTNLEREVLRNKIRLDLIPMLKDINPNIIDCLARTAENVRMEIDKESEESHYHRWLSPLGFTRQQILDIYKHRPSNKISQTNQTGKIWHSASHTLLLNRGDWVLQENIPEGTTALPHLHITRLPDGISIQREDFLNKKYAYIDAEKIKGTLLIRPTKQGDTFQPFGMKNGKKLVSDYLTDKKVNLLDKQKQFVVIDSETEKIVWLVGREIDHHYRITPNTNKVHRLHIER